MPNFSGIWTVTQQMQARGASTWPATPGAPTIGTATSASATSVSVAFTAPACTGAFPAGITGYLATSTPGCFTNTGASSPIVVSGLTTGTAYTFKVKASSAAGYGPCSAASNSATPVAAGQQAYTTAGTFSWVAPTGVSSVSVVVVGPGFTGAGGALAYTNNISVTAGSSYSVKVISESVFCGAGYTRSYFINECTASAAFGSLRTGTGGGNGANPGGAGGYTGNGGARAAAGSCAAGTAGAGGGGGGGGAGPSGSPVWIGASGGVGLLGLGSNGAGGTAGGGGGGGGSGGTSGGSSSSGSVGNGGLYGGGAGINTCIGNGTIGASAVRIIWPGNTRSFPSTCTGNL